MLVHSFSLSDDYASRLRSVSRYAEVLRTYGSGEFNALSLVPIERERDDHRGRDVYALNREATEG